MWLNSILLPVALAASVVPAPVPPKADDWESVTFYATQFPADAKFGPVLIFTAKAPPGSQYAYRVIFFSRNFGGYLIESWNPRCDKSRIRATVTNVTSREIAGASGRQPYGTNDFLLHEELLGLMDSVGCVHRDGSYEGVKANPSLGQSAAVLRGERWWRKPQ